MAAKKPKIVTVKIKATIEVKFASYGKQELDAKEQIQILVDETLKEEDQVPLFVSTQAGEESISKIVTVSNE
jgi:hypothetical protein